MIRRVFKALFATSNKKSSQEIEREFSAYKMQKKFESEKSFKVFNFKPPSTPPQKQTQPQIMMSDISSIKEYSHQYPHFLQGQLRDKQSKIYTTLKKLVNSLYLSDLDDGIQLGLFLDAWGAMDSEETAIVQRWLSNQDLGISQIWQLLKSGLKLQNFLENRVIKHLGKIEVREYSQLFRILNYYRLKEIGDEGFFSAIEKHLVKNIETMNGTQLVEMISHYTNNASQNMQSKLNILDAVANRLRIILKHLSAKELISILYCYLKLDMFKQDLAVDIQKAIIKDIDKWRQDQIQQLLEISTNMGNRQKPIIKELIRIFYNNKIPEGLHALLYSVAIEYGVIEKDFVRRIEEKLLEQVYNMTPENVSKACWAFAAVPREDNSNHSGVEKYKLFYRKVSEIVEGGLKDYTIKQVSRMAWAMGAKQFQLDAPFWSNLQLWLQEQLSKPSACARDVSMIMWAYTNQVRLHQPTVQAMRQIILRDLSQLQGFDITMTCWFFSQIKAHNPELMGKVFLRFQEQFDTMQLLQVIKCLRWFLQEMTVEDPILTKFVRRVQLQFMEKGYYTLLNIMSILMGVKIKDVTLKVGTVLKVNDRIQALKQLQSLV